MYRYTRRERERMYTKSNKTHKIEFSSPVCSFIYCFFNWELIKALRYSFDWTCSSKIYVLSTLARFMSLSLSLILTLEFSVFQSNNVDVRHSVMFTIHNILCSRKKKIIINVYIKVAHTKRLKQKHNLYIKCNGNQKCKRFSFHFLSVHSIRTDKHTE